MLAILATIVVIIIVFAMLVGIFAGGIDGFSAKNRRDCYTPTRVVSLLGSCGLVN